jgi:small subunit ribosomal protein S21
MKHFNCEPGKGGLTVRVQDPTDERSYDKALKIFKKKVMNDGLLKEVKDRQEYERPGDKRRREKAEARRRYLKQKAQERATL